MMKTVIKKIIPNEIINFGLSVVTFFAIKFYSLKYNPFILRKDTTDINVFKSVFVLKEFKLPITINPKFIIDGGAYIGLSTLYYSSKYPFAKIIAIEPETSNFRMLETHTENLPNITRLNVGLWDKNTFLKIIDKGTGNWGFVVKEVLESEHYDIKAVTVDEILKKSGFDRIDILKLDIEGSEIQLFSSNYKSWLPKVNILVIELHDSIYSGCTHSLYSAININEWKEYREGEKVILIRKELL